MGLVGVGASSRLSGIACLQVERTQMVGRKSVRGGGGGDSHAK